MLAIKLEDYLATLAVVRPGYGWGWHRVDDPTVWVDYAPSFHAGDFALCIESFRRNSQTDAPRSVGTGKGVTCSGRATGRL
jgi:hypothetical protein